MNCECGKPVLASGRCKTCYHREYYHAHRRSEPKPRVLTVAPCTYTTAHLRLMRRRGSAAAQRCICGERAVQWALRHGTPREQEGERTVYAIRGRDRVVRSRWSPDPADYDALCMRCHLVRDGRTPQATKVTRVAERMPTW